MKIHKYIAKLNEFVGFLGLWLYFAKVKLRVCFISLHTVYTHTSKKKYSPLKPTVWGISHFCIQTLRSVFKRDSFVKPSPEASFRVRHFTFLCIGILVLFGGWYICNTDSSPRGQFEGWDIATLV